MIKTAKLQPAMIRRTIIAAVIASSSLLLAGTAEVLVTSKNSGQSVFLIAVNSETGSSKIPPGIYGLERGSNHEFELLKGNVLGASRAFNGVLGQFSDLFNRNESIAVIDGLPTVFSSRTRQNDKKSFLRLGSRECPVLDATNRRPVAINEVKDINDISIYIGEPNEEDGRQIFLISLRQPNGFGGTGITIAGMVKKSLNPDHSELEIVGSPLVVDYDFYKEAELENLVSTDSTDRVISISHLHALASPHPDDDELLRGWRHSLHKYLENFKTDKYGTTTQESDFAVQYVPELSLVDGRLHFNKLPHVAVSNHPFYVVQRADPLGNNSLINVGGTHSQAVDFGDVDLAPTFSGRIGYNDHTGGYEAYPFSTVGAAGSEAMLIMINKKPHLVFSNHGDERIRSVDVSDYVHDEVVDATGYRLVKAQAEDRHFKNYFVFSCRGKEGIEQTIAIAIDDRNGFTSIDHHAELSEQMLSDDELRNRLHVSGESDDGINMASVSGDVLFDDQSPAEITQHQRVKKSELKTPLLNLSASLAPNRGSNELVQTYLTPLESEVLVPGFVSYEKFDGRGAKRVQTGIYIDIKAKPESESADKSKSKEREVVVGELIKVGPANDLKSILDSREISAQKPTGAASAEVDQDRNPPFKIWTMAIDKQFRKENPKTGAFSTLIFVGPGPYRGDEFVPSYSLAEIPGDINRLVGVKVINGKRDRYRNVTILYFFRKSKPGEKSEKMHENGGVFAVNFDVIGGLTEPKTNRFGAISGKWLSEEEVNPSEIKYRLVSDNIGDVYWINTPEMDRLEYDFNVNKLAMREKKPIFPNRSGERTTLKHDEVVGEEKSSQMFFSSKWLLYVKSDLESHFEWFKAWAKAQGEKKPETKTNLVEEMFPHLEAYLENRATSAAPKIHEILLVEPSLKEELIRNIAGNLPFRERKLWSLNNKKLEVYAYRPRSSFSETVRELDKIKKSSDNRKVLFGDLAEILVADQIDVSKFVGKAEAGVPAVAEAELPLGEPTSDPKQAEPAATDEKTKDEKADAKPAETAESMVVEHSDEVTGSREDDEFPVPRMMVLSTEGDRVPLNKIKSRLKVTPQVPMIIVATLDEWKALNEAFKEESRAGAFSGFKINAEFLTAPWSVWSPHVPTKTSKEIVELTKVPVSRDQYQVFANLEKLLEEAATLNGKVSHRIVVVPEELKGLVRKLVLSRWATDSKKVQGPWSHNNPDLALFQIKNEGAVTQEAIWENFEAMRGAGQTRRSVLLGDMADILKAGRPAPVNPGYHFSLVDHSVTAEHGVTTLAEDNGMTGKSANNHALPHMMWLLASEGHRIDPKKEKNWSIGKSYNARIPMLIFATEKELEQMQSETAYEQRFTNLTSEFEITQLEAPTRQSRLNLVEELFKSPEIAGLNYQFEHENTKGEEARKQLVSLMVSRVEQIARSIKIEPTSAFLKAFAELKKVLTEDPKTRQSRMLDRKFFERLYRRVFPMPLGFDILAADDPLLKLKDVDQAAIAMQERGYIGPMEIKRTAIETVTSQTRSGDAGRQIPSSIIVYGDTSTGKTFLFKTLMDYMGLKPYNFDKPYDEAGYIIIKAESLADSEQAATPTKISVQRALAHLENFLTMPNGYRGFILFDDLHEGSAAVRKEIISFIQKMQEAENGVLRLRKRGADSKVSEFAEVPVRNINLWMTLNPQPNKKVLNEYVDWQDTRNLEKHIVAALSGDGVQINPSFVARWAMKLNLDSFPREAKLTGLIDRLRSGSAQEFSSNPRLTLVTPDVLDLLSVEFGEANAREFLTSAATSIMSLSEDMPKAPIYIVQPSARVMPAAAHEAPYGGALPAPRDRAAIDANQIREVLRKKTIVRPVTLNDMTSKVELMSYMLDGFRVQMYQSIISAAQQSADMNRNMDMRKREMPALFMGIVHNISEFPSVPLSSIHALPSELGAKRPEEVMEFDKAIAKHAHEGDGDFLRIRFGEAGSRSLDAESFLRSSLANLPQRGRSDVMAETAIEAQKILEEAMSAYFRTKNLRANPTIEDWAAKLTNEDPKKAVRDAGEKLLHLYFEFSSNLFGSDLIESTSEVGKRPILDYDRVRLFMMCVDKAITEMPWGQWSTFMLKVVDHSVNDIGFGLSAELQKLMFESVFSPLTTAAPEHVVQLADTSREYREFRDEKTHLQERFKKECAQFLSVKKD